MAVFDNYIAAARLWPNWLQSADGTAYPHVTFVRPWGDPQWHADSAVVWEWLDDPSRPGRYTYAETVCDESGRPDFGGAFERYTFLFTDAEVAMEFKIRWV